MFILGLTNPSTPLREHVYADWAESKPILYIFYPLLKIFHTCHKKSYTIRAALKDTRKPRLRSIFTSMQVFILFWRADWIAPSRIPLDLIIRRTVWLIGVEALVANTLLGLTLVFCHSKLFMTYTVTSYCLLLFMQNFDKIKKPFWVCPSS